MLKYMAAGAISVALWIIVLTPIIDDEPVNDQRAAAPLLDGVQPAQPAKRKMACTLEIFTGRPVATTNVISRDCTSVKVVTRSGHIDKETSLTPCASSIQAGPRRASVPTLPLFGNDLHPGEKPIRCSEKAITLYNPE